MSKLDDFISWIRSADLLKVDGSHLTDNFEINDNGDIDISYSDGDNVIEEYIDGESIENMRVVAEDSKVVLVNTNGDKITLTAIKTTTLPVPDFSQEKRTYPDLS